MSDAQYPQGYPQQSPAYQQPAYTQPAYAQPVDPNYIAYLEQRVRTLEARMATGLLSGGFFKRAFTVWGYSFVAQLIISTVIGIIVFVISLIFGATLFGAISEAMRQQGGTAF